MRETIHSSQWYNEINTILIKNIWFNLCGRRKTWELIVFQSFKNDSSNFLSIILLQFIESTIRYKSIWPIYNRWIEILLKFPEDTTKIGEKIQKVFRPATIQYFLIKSFDSNCNTILFVGVFLPSLFIRYGFTVVFSTEKDGSIRTWHANGVACYYEKVRELI